MTFATYFCSAFDLPASLIQPLAIGAILGSAVPLALALTHAWQAAILAAAGAALLLARRPIVETLLLAGAAGALIEVL